jgi:hypothetical protein
MIIKSPTMVHFRHFRHFSSFLTNLPSTSVERALQIDPFYAKQTQFPGCPNECKCCYTNELRTINYEQRTKKQTQSNPTCRGVASGEAGTYHGVASGEAGTYHGVASCEAGIYHGAASGEAGTCRGATSGEAGTCRGVASGEAGTKPISKQNIVKTLMIIRLYCIQAHFIRKS